MHVLSPVASTIESVTEKWLVDLLQLPRETVAGFVSGSSTATIIGLTTGRNYLLSRLDHDIIGEGAHSTVYKALSIIGLGNANVIKVPADSQGRLQEESLPEIDDHTLLILQAGHVNTGAFDDFEGIIESANQRLSELTKGVEQADSWSVDGHKTLNTPYDSGIILCRHKEMLVSSMHMTGSYIILSENRDNMLYTAEMSRRARAIDLWATLKGLGKKGVSELVWELHRKAVYFSKQLRMKGFEILNDVVFNQVLVRNESDEKTEDLVSALQKSGV